MLQKMLSLIQSGKFQTVQHLASALEIPPGLVVVMAETLVQKGYLKPLSSCGDDTSGDSTCQKCSSISGCLLSGSRQGWLLTEHGERFLRPVLS